MNVCTKYLMTKSFDNHNITQISHTCTPSPDRWPEQESILYSQMVHEIPYSARSLRDKIFVDWSGGNISRE